ncbi:AAA family ATPase [Methylophilus sp. DW102]|uniref:AAA family ATPase n=1 Tax=Methylophilus sp. DW102 TaxID=3095607 RepID=UPI003093DC38|nr:AAA family ATPase [Methylophilus sp. DW102]
MRIQRLYIKSYGNLNEFTFTPDQQSQTSVVIGRNGAGKSNLIEALVEIFRDLEGGDASDFYYELAYKIRGYIIEITNDPESRPKQKIIVNTQKISSISFEEQTDIYLPKHVFAYYSGWNRRLEKLFDKPTKALYKKWKSGGISDNIPLRRMFYCRKDYSQLVLLAFFLMDENPKIKEFLLSFLKIKDFESALFVMHKPFWRSSSKPSKQDLEEGDPLFWYAKGAFQTFTDRLWRHAIGPIRNEETVPKDFRDRTEEQERLYLYIKDKSTLKELMYPGEDETHFFAHLEGLHLCDLVDEVRVTVDHSKAGLIRFDQLSEGEQQLLTVLGLLHFTKGEESLFLLDEPDTHLNPAWTYEYLSLLENQVVDHSSQLLIATHNPLMIGSLKREQVRLLNRYDNEGIHTITADMPDEDPIGMGVDGLLQSEIFGLRSVLPPSVEDRLTMRYKLLGIKNKTEQMVADLARLTKELESLGIAHSFPHPYFNQFSQALARNEIMNKRDFSPEDIASLEALSDELLQNIIDGKVKN